MSRAVTAVGDDTLKFGIHDDEDNLVTQTGGASLRSDKKEVRNKDGQVVAIAYYNKTTEFSIEGVGTPSSTLGVGEVLALAAGTELEDSLPASGAKVFVDQIDIDTSNEEFVKSSISATAYEGITGN